MKLSVKLKNLREERNLKLKELAEKSGISVSFISDIEHDRRNPSIETLKKLAKALNVPADEFLKDKNSDKNIPNELTKRDEKDIAKDVEKIMSKLDKNEDGPTYYNGEEMKEEDKELFKAALELALKRIKVENKKTYTPKKYRK